MVNLDMEKERALFAEYLGLLEDQSQVWPAFDAAVSEAQRVGREKLEEPGLAERQLRDSVRSVEHRLSALRSRIGRLTATAEVSGNVEVDAFPDPGLRSVHDCEAALEGIESDLRVAESSWEWIERNRPSIVPVANTPVLSSADETAPVPIGLVDNHEVKAGPNATLLWVAVIVVVLVMVTILLVSL